MNEIIASADGPGPGTNRTRPRKAIISRRPSRSSTGRCGRSSMTICSACSTSRATVHGGGDGPDGLYFQDTRFLSRLSLRLGGLRAAAARLGGARRQWRADRRSRQCRSARRGGPDLAAARQPLSRPAQVPARRHLLRAIPAAALRPAAGSRFRSRSPSTPISPTCSKCAASAGRGAGRCASSGSTSARVRFTYLGLDEIERRTTAPFRSARRTC